MAMATRRPHAGRGLVDLWDAYYDDRQEIIGEPRSGDGWRSQVLHGADEFSLLEFGPGLSG
jgi:hypothetical protein